ncbi:MAG: MurT ligase domain-containing protein [Firmicutes bacterium]|nr:MurT ligase domain-containing protein [Bacillota bacterium]
MLKITAVLVAKILIFIGRVFGKKGSSTPGHFALMIYPNLLKELAHDIKGGIIVVCGTNGKTTTNNLARSMLSFGGEKVVCNEVGANMLYGVVTAFAQSARLSGRLNADHACIEIDEISITKVLDHFIPNIFIITNLFPDQLDRSGGMDVIKAHLTAAAEKAKGCTFVLNADDPIVSSIGHGKSNCVYFGVQGAEKAQECAEKKGHFCPLCENELAYGFYHYSSLGDYCCTNCGFSRPKTAFLATDVSVSGEKTRFTIDGKEIVSDLPGLYNIYNIVAAYAAASFYGVTLNGLNEILSGHTPQTGRMESFYIGKKVVLNLSKNPAGFNQAIATIIADKRKKDIVVVINDNAQDGRDVSWIWDVDFECLCDKSIGEVTASGLRCNDVLVRLKYAQHQNTNCKPDISAAVRDTLKANGDVLYVLVNYTALFQTQKILKALEGEKTN